jgi:hypothetical protein
MVQQIGDIQDDLSKSPVTVGQDDPRVAKLRELQQATLEYQSKLQNAPANRQEISDLENRLKLARQAQALKAEELSWDERIANARKAGLDTGGMEAQKQLAILGLQAEHAKANGQPTAEREAKLGRSQLEGDQASGRGDAALERERNRRLKGRDSQGVDAVDQFKALRELENRYADIGLSKEQARKDFDLSIAANNLEQPRISVDSLQSVGGGGFSSNPNADYPRRTVALTEQMVAYLRTIAEKGAQGGID